MIQSEYITRILTPNEGYKLTQSAEVTDEERIFSDKIYLAVNDSMENWKEVTDEEAVACRTRLENKAKTQE